MAALREGKAAPDFTLPAGGGETVKLSDLKGQNVVLYFYPKDDTPGCTKEACDFRDTVSAFKKANARVLGLSADPLNAHERFKKKYKLPFSLLSDEDKKVIKKYGVWKEKSLYGKKYMGIERTTVIIDAKGKVHKIFSKVKVDGHSRSVLEALQQL